jgi:hypothetical protein
MLVNLIDDNILQHKNIIITIKYLIDNNINIFTSHYFKLSDMMKFNKHTLIIFSKYRNISTHEYENKWNLLEGIVQHMVNEEELLPTYLTMIQNENFRRMCDLPEESKRYLLSRYRVPDSSNIYDRLILLYARGVFINDIHQSNIGRIPFRVNSIEEYDNVEDFPIFIMFNDIIIDDLIRIGLLSKKEITYKEWKYGILDENNPYSYVHSSFINKILQSRDITVDNINELNELDTIFPNWKSDLLSTNLSNLSSEELIMYAAFNYIDCRHPKWYSLSKESLICLIECIIYLRIHIYNINQQEVNINDHNKNYYNIEDVITDLNHGFSINSQQLLFNNTLNENILFSLARNKTNISENILKILLELNEELLLFIPTIIKHDEIYSFCPYNEIMYLLLYDITPNSYDSKKKRSIYIESFSNLTKDLLLNFYDTADINNVIKKEEHMFEKYLYMLSNNEHEDLINELNISIPNSMDINEYLYNNILSYKDVDITLKWPCEDLNKLSDKELLMCNAQFYYENRTDLIRKLQNIKEIASFFIPKERNCINEFTSYYNEIRDEDIDVIAYGTIDNYYGYEIDEFLNCFSEYNDVFIFKNPNLKSVFTDTEISELKDLAKKYGYIHLVDKIDYGLSQKINLANYDQELISVFKNFKSKDIINYILKQLYNIGMYMRSWKGPGHDYPIESVDTHNVINESLINLLLDNISIKIDQLVDEEKLFMENLKMVDYNLDTIIIQNDFLKNMISKILSSEYCIRMSSNLLIGTSYYYLEKLFNYKHEIHPFNISRIS